MAKRLQLRRGTTSNHASFATGAQGEITVDTTEWTVVIHDGTDTTGDLGGQTRCKLELKGQIHPFMKSSTNQSLVLGY